MKNSTTNSTEAENNDHKNQGKDYKVELDRLVSVPFGQRYLQGVVKDISPEFLVIDNYTTGQVKVPNNDLIHVFFPGQKFDIREFGILDQNVTPPVSLRQKLDAFLEKTQFKSLDGLMMLNKKSVGQLLAGKLTSQIFEGSSLIKKEGQQSKVIVDWAAKFQLYRGKDKNLKLNIQFRQKELGLQVYGKDVTPEQHKEMTKNNKTITLDRENKKGEAFKVFAKFDKDLNRIVTSPYSKGIEERMIKSVAKNVTKDKKNIVKAPDLTKIEKKNPPKKGVTR